MNWYISKIVFEISAQNTAHTRQFDEQLRLISADSEEEAFFKARAIGLAEEDAFFNDHNNMVNWEFINVAEVIPLQKLEDGIGIYSHIHETEKGDAYIHLIHQKAIFLRTHVK